MVGKKRVIAEAHKRFMRENKCFTVKKKTTNGNENNENQAAQGEPKETFRKGARPSKSFGRKQMD